MRLPMLYPASLLLAGVALPLPLAAQEVVQPLPGTTDADKLADLVRQIGRNPRDVRALVDAGDLSAKLGDTTAAASLYKRASQVDPNNARVQAGIARILVNGEHPGEALRYFNQAERAGLSPALFADDRGLAYDLIGEQERAQRDYRLALARPGQDNEDEVRRRYALSLGISGRKDEALQQIDALLRKSDRGAWRARAFILAMNGDATGANTIATTMMPRGMAGGLAAFFTRLPTLSAADRAFAVHFGEVTPTPERIADARLVPALPALAPDPYARSAGVQVAAQTATPVSSARAGRGGRDARQAAVSRGRSGAAERAAAVTTTPTPVQPLPTPGQSVPTQIAQASVPVRPSYALQSAQSITPSSRVSTQVTNAMPATPAQLAQPSSVPSQVVTTAPTQIASVPLPARVTYSSQAPAAGTSLAAAAETRTVVPATTGSTATAGSAANPAAQANNAVRSSATAVVGATGSSSPLGSVASSAPTSSTPAPTAVAASTPAAPAIVPGAGTASSAAVSQPVQVAAVTTPSAPPVPARPSASPRIENEDTILARIVANISIPASELGVSPMPGAAPQPGSTATIDEAAVVAERNAAAIERRREREASAAAEPRVRVVTPARATETQTASSSTAGDRRTKAEAEPASSKTRRGAKAKQDVAPADTDEPAAGRRGGSARTRKGSADEPKLTPKQVAAKAKADAKELADAKAAAAEKKAVRAEPERYWVQVAGGATQADLNKAWKGARAKSPLLARRTGYTTPLRATNRVVTGPFKTQAEAQAMVNKLSKDGVSAFTFTSEAGQKMNRLGEK